MAVTARELKDTITKGPVTVQYPRVKEAPTPRARGVISLVEDNCTVCMLCARQCPVWCIYIEGHKDFRPAKRAGGKPSSWNYLDRFDIDYSLCMYCAICVEVCPFDALHWSPEFEYSDLTLDGLLHDMERLGKWEATVPAPQEYEKGAEIKGGR